MKIRLYLSTLTLISLSSLLGSASQAGAQVYTLNRLDASPRLQAKSAKTPRAKMPDVSDYSDLYSFCSSSNGDCTDGAGPAAGLIMDSKGNLYGTTSGGGTNTTADDNYGGGTVFELEPPAQTGDSWTENVLWNFGSGKDGYNPVAGLILDSKGNLYGTTFSGGTTGGGIAFKLEPPAEAGGGWTEKVLYNFCAHTGCPDGENPAAGLVEDSSGNLYGTTANGGTGSNGTVFKISSTGVETVLWSFGSTGSGDGANPEAGLILISGDLYGTTFQGGASSSGSVFELTPPAKTGATWTESLLYSFCAINDNGLCADGEYPVAALIEDTAGNLYSTTSYGGANNQGTVFELDTARTETVLYNFCSASKCADGSNPFSGLFLDAAGNLYGTTSVGGADNAADGTLSGGTVFELTPPSQAGALWSDTVLYNFCSSADCADGSFPIAGLIPDSSGNLYGTAQNGGANTKAESGNGGGAVFIVNAGAGGGIATVTLSSSANPSSVGQSVTFSVIVSGRGVTPTGSVTFEEGTTVLGTETLVNGKASFATSFSAAGKFDIVADYSGDKNYGSSNSRKLDQIVDKNTTTTALASSLNPSIYGQTVTLTATVSSSGSTPTGTVAFMNGSKLLSRVTLSDGVAKLATSALPVGTLTITAEYSGDAGHLKSKSSPLSQVVNEATTTTAVTSSVNPSNDGEPVKFTATVTSPTTIPTGSVTFMDGATVLATETLGKGKGILVTSSLPSGANKITAVYAGTTNITGSTSPVYVQTVK